MVDYWCSMIGFLDVTILLCVVFLPMLLNEGVTIAGQKCLLVPYSEDLVETYHGWFLEDPQLLSTTGSELLSLEEEYMNQCSWRIDESKLTFLIRDKLDDNALCGDINCFFSDYFTEDYNDFDGEGEWKPDGLVGEINLMVARKASRRKGIAEEAITLFLEYIRKHIPNVKLFIAKIQDDNLGSISLFQKLGFVQFKHVQCFNEVHHIKWEEK